MKIIGGLLAIALLFPAAAQAQQKASDPQHQMLAGLAGHWTVAQSLWLEGAKNAKIDTGAADFSMVLNGRHLRQTLHIADGTGFEGLGYIGYDTADGRFFTTWMDVNFPGLVVAYGGPDAAGKSYVFTGTMAPATPVREVMTLIDAGHMRYEYYESHAGKESLTVRLDYSRSK